MCQVPLFSSRAAGTSRVGFEAVAAPVKLRKAGMESDMSAPKQSPAGQCAQGPGKCSAVHCGGLPVQPAGARQVKLLQYSTPHCPAWPLPASGAETHHTSRRSAPPGCCQVRCMPGRRTALPRSGRMPCRQRRLRSRHRCTRLKRRGPASQSRSPGAAPRWWAPALGCRR
jgi:hypothetical protein